MIGDIMQGMDELTTHNCAAKAGVDIALHDLVGKMIVALVEDLGL